MMPHYIGTFKIYCVARERERDCLNASIDNTIALKFELHKIIPVLNISDIGISDWPLQGGVPAIHL